MEWMMMPLKRYADFDGRSRRTEFWMFTLMMVVVYSILIGAMVAIAGFGNMPATGPSADFWLVVGLLALVGLGTFLPHLAVQVRRFHDQDKSGWFVLLGFVPYVGGIVVLVFMCIEGTRGPNRFGPDPKDRDGSFEVARYGEAAVDPLPRRPDLL